VFALGMCFFEGVHFALMLVFTFFWCANFGYMQLDLNSAIRLYVYFNRHINQVR
jgi:hypothetical protein